MTIFAQQIYRIDSKSDNPFRGSLKQPKKESMIIFLYNGYMKIRILMEYFRRIAFDLPHRIIMGWQNANIGEQPIFDYRSRP